MKKEKGPFAPISLKGNQADWLVDYLEGKIRVDVGEEKRRKIIEKAEELENVDAICLD